MLYNQNWKKTEAPVDFTKPTLEGLAYVLRHKELWPKDFVWNFYDCDRCAMGLAYRLFSGICSPNTRDVGEPLGMDRDDARRIFLVSQWKLNISPTDIADRIDKYLESRRG